MAGLTLEELENFQSGPKSDDDSLDKELLMEEIRRLAGRDEIPMMQGGGQPPPMLPIPPPCFKKLGC